MIGPPVSGTTANRVAGRTALVTGAGSGLGRAISLALGQAGARVLLTGRDRAALDRVAEEVAALGATARVGLADISSPDQVDALREQFEDEEVSILVNNAGVPGPVAFLTEIS